MSSSSSKSASLLSKLASPGGLRAVEVALAKAPERLLPADAKTSGNSNKFRPWEVTLNVIDSVFNLQPHEVCFYIRAENPQTAVHMVTSYWRKWERLEKNVSDFEKYPDYIGISETLCLDDNDYAKAWKVARRFPHRFVGEAENPTCFTFYPPSDVDPQLLS